MDITDHIASNLDTWMASTPNLDTLKKVAARSGVGFGTVQRARNGDGNTTIKNLTAIAKAFNRSIEELLRAPADYAKGGIVTDFPARQSAGFLIAPMTRLWVDMRTHLRIMPSVITQNGGRTMWDNTENPRSEDEASEPMNWVDWLVILVTASVSCSAFGWAAWQTIEAAL